MKSHHFLPGQGFITKGNVMPRINLDELAAALFGPTDAGCCVFCKQPFSFNENSNDGMPGRIYSEAGLREARRSGICETCFDETTSFGDE